MVRQLFLPAEGGGSLRRFLAIRKHLFRDKWHDDRPIRGPISLFDFRRPDDVADLRESLLPAKSRSGGILSGWRVSDDSVIGGFSSSLMDFHEGHEKKGDNNNHTIAPPFLRWSGKLSTEINRNSHLARNVTRSGFAAIFTPEFPLGAPLGSKYKALEICCRTDGRTYAVNLKVESYFPEDMYQGFISGTGQSTIIADNATEKVQTEADDITKTDENTQIISVDEHAEEQPILDVREHLKARQQIISSQDPNNHPYHGYPPAGFQRLILPFTDFALTSRGRMRHTQRDLDGSVNIESLGFTLMDGNDGDFCFDLVSLRAVNLMAGEVVGTKEDDAREEEMMTHYNQQHSKNED
mmetsp:Transcript_28227/g.40336  ORF Transcript_28227/g.40336 Transcript_28227/m.40336 type:complete len:353 (+) Transcript_28227:41-1099(+)